MGGESSKQFYDKFLAEMKKSYDSEKIKGVDFFVQTVTNYDCILEIMYIKETQFDSIFRW